MVISLKYTKGQDFDDNFMSMISAIKKQITENNDDFLLVCVGDTGSGKSNLSLFAYDLYYSLFDKKPDNIDNIAFKESDFADRLDYVRTQDMPRFLCYDEANVNKRNSMKTWNKDLIDIYFSIRGKNIFHWWNNPSVNVIDGTFVDEKINGLIYVLNKTKDRPRIYLFFRREDLKSLLKSKDDKLTLDVLKKNYHKAFYIGCFKKYNGALLKDYLAKKEERMDDKIIAFKNKYGTKEKYHRVSDMVDKLKISRPRFEQLCVTYIDKGMLIQDKHYIVNPTGIKLFKDDALSVFKSNAKIKNYKKIKDNMDITTDIYNVGQQI